MIAMPRRTGGFPAESGKSHPFAVRQGDPQSRNVDTGTPTYRSPS
jgi:hypothetical protein